MINNEIRIQTHMGGRLPQLAHWRRWLRLYVTGVVAVTSFAMGLLLMSVHRVGSLNHPISGYLYSYKNGRDTAIVLMIFIFVIALVTIRFASSVDAKTKALVDIGYDVKFIESIRRHQAVIAIFMTLTCLSIILDVCLSG
ncbi:hypothetical protein [Mesorhizobium sp. M0618]|uniref:hypothetical protein n=1 Tax=unclassified Mesorhizobium TaxID=325217 RepID=UPI00333DE32F